MQAIGTYIVTLRLAHNLTQLQVAAAAGTTPTQIWRYESGTLKGPEMPLLFRVVAAVRGRGDDIMKLLLADDPTDDYARALAEAQLTPEQQDSIGRFAGSDEETIALLETVYEMSQHNKALMREVRTYINGLLAGHASRPPADTPPAASRRRRRAK